MIYKIKKILYRILAIVLLIGVLPYGVYAADEDTDILYDKVKPSLDYAYVEDGVLRLTISDNVGLDSRPIYFKADRELRYYYLNIDDYYYEYEGRYRREKYYEIEVDIPSKVSVMIRDKAGNESVYNLNIKEDNAPVTKEIPIFIRERLSQLKQSVVDTFEGFDNIFEMEYGKVIHAITIYEDTIRDNYRYYNKNEIKFKVNGLSMDKEGNIKLDKYGIFKVTMTHNKDKTFEETAYILIKPDWRRPDDRRLPVNVSPYIVYSDKIKLADYYRYDDEITSGKSKSKSKVDTSYMLVYNGDTGDLVTMNDTISLELNKPYTLSVLNFEDNSMQDFYVMRQEKVKSGNRNFSDLDKGHWAIKDINSLVSRGLLSGYPDGTFNPSGNITVKEFMTILSRYIATSPNKGKAVSGDATTPVTFGTWGYIESKSVLDRITDANLYRFDYMNLDRLITREEVAFLIDNTLELGIPYNTDANRLRDIGLSMYPSSIEKLVDLGFISGYPDGSFKPYNNITRAEVAALFARIK